MDIGLLLPAGRAQLESGWTARSIIDTAITAERLGFDSIWTGDSIVRARIEPLTLLATLATATERVTLGTAALLPALRDPVLAANAIASLDLLSGGRLIVGVGAGFPGLSEPEFALTGVSFRTRVSRLDDIVTLWKQLWSGTDPTVFHGRCLHYDWLPPTPQPDRPGGPPVWLASATSGALVRAGRMYDGWLPYPPDPATFIDGLAVIKGHANGRPVTPALFATVYVDDDPDRGRQALQHYCETTYRLPLETVSQIQVMITGPVEQIAAELGRYAGVEHILLRIAELRPDPFTEQLSELAALTNCPATLLNRSLSQSV